MYTFWKFLHLVGVVGFLLAHGVSLGVALKLRRERQPERIAALLELSAASLVWFYLFFVVLLAAGVVAGFIGRWWSSGWIWVSLAVFVLVSALMGMLARPYYTRIRKVAAMRAGSESAAEDIAAVASSRIPVVITLIGLMGLLVIVYLMVFKPF